MSKKQKGPAPEEPSSRRGDVNIELQRVRLWTTLKFGWLALKLGVEGPAQDSLVLALAIAVVTLIGGALAAALIALGAPVWAALTLAILPTLALGAGIVVRQRSSRVADAGKVLGRPRTSGLTIEADDAGDDNATS